MDGSNPTSCVDPSSGKSPQGNRCRPVVRRHVALLPWGHTLEDFLDGLGVSFDQFCSEMSGGWLFGYVQALQLASIQVTIFCFSSQTRITASRRHQPTGAEICLIPANRSYRWMRRFFSNPYAWETDKMFSGSKLPKAAKRLLRHLLPYLATPWSLGGELRRRGVDIILCQEYEYARFDVRDGPRQASPPSRFCHFSRR